MENNSSTDTGNQNVSRRIAVLGGGSFGTAMAKVLAENGHSVNFWMRNPEQVEAIRSTRTNARYFPEVTLEGDIRPTTDFE